MPGFAGADISPRSGRLAFHCGGGLQPSVGESKRFLAGTKVVCVPLEARESARGVVILAERNEDSGRGNVRVIAITGERKIY